MRLQRRKKLIAAMIEHNLAGKLQAEGKRHRLALCEVTTGFWSLHDGKKKIVMVSRPEVQRLGLHGVPFCVFQMLDGDSVKMALHFLLVLSLSVRGFRTPSTDEFGRQTVKERKPCKIKNGETYLFSSPYTI
nr:hypothetical protein [Propionivibrio soli]